MFAYVCCVYYSVMTNFVDFEEVSGLKNFVKNDYAVQDGLTFVSSSTVILCGRLGSKHQLPN